MLVDAAGIAFDAAALGLRLGVAFGDAVLDAIVGVALGDATIALCGTPN